MIFIDVLNIITLIVFCLQVYLALFLPFPYISTTVPFWLSLVSFNFIMPFTTTQAFIAPVPLPSSLKLSKLSPKSHSRRRPILRQHPICLKHEEATQPPPQIPHVPDVAPTSTPLSMEERKEKARKARIEAERLELMAAKARLEFERAELAAERKKLELEKIKTLKEVEKERNTKGSDSEQVLTTSSQSTSETSSSTSTSPLDNKPADPPQVLSNTLSELLGSQFPRVAEADIRVIKEKLCGMNTFFVTEVDRSPFDERIVFRGNLRMPEDKIIEEMERLAEQERIASRVRFFLLEDPKEEDTDDSRPVLVVLPKEALPNQTSSISVVLSSVVAICACATTFSYGIGIFGLTPEVITQISNGNLEQALLTLPISTVVILLALLHDAGHRVMAALRDVELGLPFFIPSLQIGTYGIITPLETYPKLRKDLFDVAVGGPIAGTVASLIALIAGMVLTSSGEVADWFPQVPSALFHASVLVGAIADTILPPGFREHATIAVHPLTVAGYTGLLSNALNLMPIGRLDGGRIVQALYGRAVAGRATAITLILQGFSSLLGNSPLLLFWGLVCVFLQRESDYPCRNEVIEPDNTRTAIGISALVVMLLVLVPFPDQVGNILGQF